MTGAKAAATDADLLYGVERSSLVGDDTATATKPLKTQLHVSRLSEFLKRARVIGSPGSAVQQMRVNLNQEKKKEKKVRSFLALGKKKSTNLQKKKQKTPKKSQSNKFCRK